MKELLESWGRLSKTKTETISGMWIQDNFPMMSTSQSLLPYGLGRSYGDSCLNEGNILFNTKKLNHFISFDSITGSIRCEAGVTFDQLLQLIIPHGWFLPTTPGTKYITVGGAIANDVHGKNHHKTGSFGNSVSCFELLRSDGSRFECSRTRNSEWFSATIGGLGLTGIITWVEFKLRKIKSAYIDVVSTKFSGLNEFFDLNDDADKQYEHTVAWIDCLAKGPSLGRGIFIAGNYSDKRSLRIHPGAKFSITLDCPNFMLNSLSISSFNFAYYYKQFRKQKSSLSHYNSFFYPLDSLGGWNRIYGSRGFYQYQSVIPMHNGKAATQEMLRLISKSGQASFLAVLKTFGDVPRLGMLSFPRRGVTLALDFPNNGLATQKLFSELDCIVRESGGVLYPAKDARMSASDFASFYPQYLSFQKYKDPRISSSFWRRVTNI
jgi:FAD/FMN-containing dehydrogenase